MNGKSLAASTKKKVGKLQRQFKTIKKTGTIKKELEISSLKKKYRIFYDELPGLLHTIDIDGNILDCNREYAETFGYSKEELIGKAVFTFVAEEGRQAFHDSFEAWKKTGRVKNKPVWFKKKNGTKFLGLVSANNLYDENGKMIGSNTLIKDITEIHDARSELEESQKELQVQVKQLERTNHRLLEAEQKYKNLYDKTPTLLRTITTEGVLTDCNESYARALGYTKEEALGMSVYDHTAERSVEDMKNNLEQWKKTHETLPAEIWLKRKNGSIFPTMLSGTSLYDEHGKLIGRTLALTDMTEIYEARTKLEVHEKHLQQQLSQVQKSNDLLTVAEKRYRILYEKTPVLLRTITTEGILTDCNESYARALGYTKEEAIGMSIYDHTATRSIDDMKNNLEQWKESHQVLHKEIWMKRKDGSIFPSLLSGASIYDEHGNVIGRTVALTDMTEIYDTRKKLQDDEARIRDQYDELKKAHDLLTITAKRYRILYEKTPVLLRTITTEGILTDCNESYARALGYTKEEAIGMSFYDHTALQSVEDLKNNLKQWHQTNEVPIKEIWMKRKDGSIFPSLLSGASIYDEHGNVIGRTVALTDMTEIYDTRKKLQDDEARIRDQYDELKKAHDLLTITEKRYRILYEKTPVLLRTITTERILTDCNESYARALGYTKEEAIGMSFYDHTALQSVEDLKNNLKQWHQTNEVPIKEIWMKRKDGSIFPSLLSGASIYDEHGNVIGRTVALTDMTEIYDTRKKLQDDEARIRDQYDELKKAHDLLTITAKRYRILYEKTPVLLRTITTERILTDCNESYARALGYTKEEAIGMSFYDHTALQSVEDL